MKRVPDLTISVSHQHVKNLSTFEWESEEMFVDYECLRFGTKILASKTRFMPL